MDNQKRQELIMKFLEGLGFETKVSDFIGAWLSKERSNSFGGIINKSYMLGFVEDEKSSIVVDALGISTLDNPFTTDSILIQKYNEEEAYEETASERLRYYPDPAVKKTGFQKNFPILAYCEDKVVTGQFDIVGEDLSGYFFLAQNDNSNEFLEAAGKIKEKLMNQLGGHGPLI